MSTAAQDWMSMSSSNRLWQQVEGTMANLYLFLYGEFTLEGVMHSARPHLAHPPSRSRAPALGTQRA